MILTSMNDLNFTEVPLRIEDDINKSHTTWLDGKCVKMDEERWMTYFVMHKTETRIEETPEGKCVERQVCLAVPVRVKKGCGSAALEAASQNLEVYLAVLPLFADDNIEIMRDELIDTINDYDKSQAVNNFSINGDNIWLPFETRSRLQLRIQSEKSQGAVNTTLWFNGKTYELDIDDALQMLQSLEIYASQCYDNTQRHLANARTLVNAQDVLEYDYAVGYPQMLNL